MNKKEIQSKIKLLNDWKKNDENLANESKIQTPTTTTNNNNNKITTTTTKC